MLNMLLAGKKTMPYCARECQRHNRRELYATKPRSSCTTGGLLIYRRLWLRHIWSLSSWRAVMRNGAGAGEAHGRGAEKLYTVRPCFPVHRSACRKAMHRSAHAKSY